MACREWSNREIATRSCVTQWRRCRANHRYCRGLLVKFSKRLVCHCLAHRTARFKCCFKTFYFFVVHVIRLSLFSKLLFSFRSIWRKAFELVGLLFSSGVSLITLELCCLNGHLATCTPPFQLLDILAKCNRFLASFVSSGFVSQPWFLAICYVSFWLHCAYC